MKQFINWITGKETRELRKASNLKTLRQADVEYTITFYSREGYSMGTRTRKGRTWMDLDGFLRCKTGAERLYDAVKKHRHGYPLDNGDYLVTASCERWRITKTEFLLPL